MSLPLDLGDVLKMARLSPCGTYRYSLNRRWDIGRPRVGWIMLNPSTADAEVDDPTIRRCMGFARSWGYGGIVVRNLYALRATDPRELRKHSDPIGPDNLLDECASDPLTIAAWGAHGAWRDRGNSVRSLLNRIGIPLYHLGLTKDGHPRHPLYLKADLQPTLWEVGQ